ncbi:MAG: DUF4062 domain-containing protein [Nitrospira sp.]|nr:MAG: DUF4062 domain-containing protein [Nitrospira sp.]
MAYKAFVSSTFEDLKDHRAHVIRSLRRAGFVVDPMEEWPADSEEPKRFSQDRLHGCDLCVLLVGFRRGYVPDGETRSITQMEYDAAVKQGVDIVPFMLLEDAPWPRKFDEMDKDVEIKTWREQLKKRHGVESFGLEPRSIDLTGTLARWLTQHALIQAEPQKHVRIDWPDGKSPYPGLLWFDENYASLFFGRDREIDDLVGKMSELECRVLLVSGASGSGKSSLVAAGLWQAIIDEGRLPGSQHWVWQRIQPSDGETPFHSLAQGLKQIFRGISRPAPELAKDLAGRQTTIGELLAPHLAQGQEVVLFIDQLEELFTRGFHHEDIQNVLAQLVATAQYKQNRVRLVATVRSEFIARLEESEPILQVLNAGYHYHLGPVSPRALQDMIEQPAYATGHTFDPQVVDEILRESAQEPGSLPLVAYVLKQLYERRCERTFTHDTYKAIGGVAGAIGTQADQVMAGLAADVRGAFDNVFAELVHLERERPPTRKRAAFSRFISDKAANYLIDALAGPDCRVLVKSGNEQDSVVEVAHEKLFVAWHKLKDWIDSNGADLRLIDYSEEAAIRWHDLGGHLHELWRYERAQSIQQALARFKKTPSVQLGMFLQPQQMLIEKLTSEKLSHQERLLIGQKLAEFGDPRPGVGVCQDGLPDIAWIEIPQGGLMLQAVEMAKYPVTNSQFQVFIGDCGYGNDAWWEGLEKIDAAAEPRWKDANAPRETVSWYEAVAFCRWLSHKTKSRIRLPTEWEWQQAATGGDPTREYPWPGGWDTARCNSWESRLGQTTAVGLYPSGTSHHGLLDLSGNIWEWCQNGYEQPEAFKSVVTKASVAGQRVVRGGSWDNEREVLRVSNRSGSPADDRGSSVGFRLVQEIPSF